MRFHISWVIDKLSPFLTVFLSCSEKGLQDFVLKSTKESPPFISNRQEMTFIFWQGSWYSQFGEDKLSDFPLPISTSPAYAIKKALITRFQDHSEKSL